MLQFLLRGPRYLFFPHDSDHTFRLSSHQSHSPDILVGISFQHQAISPHRRQPCSISPSPCQIPDTAYPVPRSIGTSYSSPYRLHIISITFIFAHDLDTSSYCCRRPHVFSQIVSSEFLSYFSPRQQNNYFCRQSRARAHQPLAVCRARVPSHFFHECHVSPRSSCFSYQQLPLWLAVVVLSLSSRHPVPRIASCVCGGSRNLG